MHNNHFLKLLLCIAVVLPGWTTLVDAKDEVDYDKCSLTVTALDADNIGAELMCSNGSDEVEVLKEGDPIPVGTPKSVPGTPITFFGDTNHVVQISGNAGGDTMFELYDSKFVSLPENLGKVDSALLVQDAQLRLTNSKFNFDDISQGSGRVRTIILRSGKGTLVVSGCEFLGATDVEVENQYVALEGSGEGTVLVENSTFTGLDASAISWQSEKEDKTNLHFRDCSFRNNRGPQAGVAYLKSPLNMTMENCVVSENTTPGLGGVLHIEVEDPTDLLHVSLIGTTFNSNEAGKAGSVVYLSAGKSSGSGGSGNAPELVLENCNITNNKKSTAVIVSGGGYISTKVIGGEFIGNEGVYNGGAIGLLDVGKVVLNGTKFERNVVTGTSGGDESVDNPSGGAVHVRDVQSMEVIGCQFKDNQALSTMADMGGGALYVKGTEKKPAATLILLATTFDRNEAGYGGGSLFVDTLASLKIAAVNLSNSITHVGPGGGALLRNIKKITTTNLHVDKNTGGTNGGGVAIDTCEKIELYNTTFQWSVATENGGALYLRVATEIQMSGVEFGSNTAKENGGAVSILGEPGMMLTDSSFRNNSAGLAGGAISIVERKSLESLINSLLRNRAAAEGALLINNLGKDAKLIPIQSFLFTRCIFEDNDANNNGGAVQITGMAKSKFTTSVFTGCRTMGDGACIHVTGPPPSPAVSNGDGAKLEISKTNFTDVSAANAGGALFAKDVPEISVTSVVIDGAEGKSGGGTSIEGAKDVIFSKSEILSCDAVFGDGGGLKITSVEKLQILDCVFRGTHAKGTGNGGALFLDTIPKTKMYRSDVSDSSASGNGGAVLLSQGSAEITNCSFSDTTAEKGGAFAVDGDAVVYMTDTDILRSKSSSMEGGVLITLSCKAKVNVVGKCVVDIPFQTGQGGTKNKEEAEKEAITSADPKCGTSHIVVQCEHELWRIKGQTKHGYVQWIYISIGIVAVCLILAAVFIIVRCKVKNKYTEVRNSEGNKRASTRFTPLMDK